MLCFLRQNIDYFLRNCYPFACKGKGIAVTVKCPKCQTENPDTARYCSNCATPLPDSSEVSYTKTLETPVQELTRGILFAERYEIIEELGTGGMGKVYRVEDTKAKEEIALKLIKSEIAADKKQSTDSLDKVRQSSTRK